MHNRNFKNILLLIGALLVSQLSLASTIRRSATETEKRVPEDDLNRGMSILRSPTGLFTQPSETSQLKKVNLEVGKKYYVLGLSLDGRWAQILTRKNIRGWVPIHTLKRVYEEDIALTDAFGTLANRHHWKTYRVALSAGVYPTQDVSGEVAVTLFPRGLGGLLGESLDLGVGVVSVKATDQVPHHYAYRGFLQWPFRTGPMGNVHIGPRLGFEQRKIYNGLAVDSVQTRGHAILGSMVRFFPSRNLGISLMPEFLIRLSGPNEATFHAMLALTFLW